jgi:hypothetical protein
MSAETVSVSTKFDVLAPNPVQTSILETTETAYKPIASVDQSDLKFLIPADHDTYIDLNIHLLLIEEVDGEKDVCWNNVHQNIRSGIFCNH